MVNNADLDQSVHKSSEGSCAQAAVTFSIKGDTDLNCLTKSLSDFCSRAEKTSAEVTVLLDLSSQSTDWPGEVSIAQVTRWEREVRRLERLPYMIIACAEGMCTGPALDLFLTADLRVASPTTSLQMSINDHETWPGMSLYRLVLELGLAHARRLVILGKQILVDQALEIGLLDEVATEPLTRASSLAAELGRRHGKEISIRRGLALEATTSAYDDALGAHLAACARELKRLAANSKVG